MLKIFIIIFINIMITYSLFCDMHYFENIIHGSYSNLYLKRTEIGGFRAPSFVGIVSQQIVFLNNNWNSPFKQEVVFFNNKGEETRRIDIDHLIEGKIITNMAMFLRSYYNIDYSLNGAFVTFKYDNSNGYFTKYSRNITNKSRIWCSFFLQIQNSEYKGFVDNIERILYDRDNINGFVAIDLNFNNLFSIIYPQSIDKAYYGNGNTGYFKIYSWDNYMNDQGELFTFNFDTNNWWINKWVKTHYLPLVTNGIINSFISNNSYIILSTNQQGNNKYVFNNIVGLSNTKPSIINKWTVDQISISAPNKSFKVAGIDIKYNKSSIRTFKYGEKDSILEAKVLYIDEKGFVWIKVIYKDGLDGISKGEILKFNAKGQYQNRIFLDENPYHFTFVKNETEIYQVSGNKLIKYIKDDNKTKNGYN